MDIDFAWLEEHIFNRSLSADEKAALNGSIVLLEFDKKEEMMTEGDDADGLYLLRSGRANVLHDSHGQKVRVGEATEGAQLGDMAMFDKQPYSTTITARQPCQVYKIPREDLEKLMATHHGMARDIMINTIRRLSGIVRGMNTVNAYSQQYIQGRRI